MGKWTLKQLTRRDWIILGLIFANPGSLCLLLFLANGIAQSLQGPEYLTTLPSTDELVGMYVLDPATRKESPVLGYYPDGEGELVLHADGTAECIGPIVIRRDGHRTPSDIDVTLIPSSSTCKWECAHSDAEMMHEFVCLKFSTEDARENPAPGDLLLRPGASGMQLCLPHHLDDPDSRVRLIRIARDPHRRKP